MFDTSIEVLYSLLKYGMFIAPSVVAGPPKSWFVDALAQAIPLAEGEPVTVKDAEVTSAPYGILTPGVAVVPCALNEVVNSVLPSAN